MPTVIFLSEACALDKRSGAAHSARAMLHALSNAGYDCHSITTNLCDGVTDFPLETLDPALARDESCGKWVRSVDGSVVHDIYVARSTLHKSFRPWELKDFLEGAEARIAALKPDLVLTFGSNTLRPLWAQAQQLGARTVFYIANAGYASEPPFDFTFIDDYVVPSQALADLYQAKLGIAATPVGDLVDAPFDGRRNLTDVRIKSRRARYVTMINPDPHKGGLLFINIAAQAMTVAPDLKFRAVESRWGQDQWRAHGADMDKITNLEWHPNTNNTTKIYDEAALLLVPSLWFEASARVIAEALLAGVPVMAMKSGGIEEQLNGGGFLFDLPPEMETNRFATPPTADLHSWVQFTKILMEDDTIYKSAVGVALKASSIHKRDAREAQLISIIERILSKPVLAGMSDDPELARRITAQRAKIRAALETANNFVHDPDGSSEPYAEVMKICMRQPAVRDALQAIKDEEYAKARAILEQYLRLVPEDIAAIGILAKAAEKQDREGEARRLMQRITEMAPGFLHGHHQYIRYLQTSGDAAAALSHFEGIQSERAGQSTFKSIRACLLVNAHRFKESLAAFEEIFEQTQGTPFDWMQYALALKTVGHSEKAVEAYRKAISIAPGHGAAWHALSNMKLAVFTEDDVELMNAQLAREDLTDEDRSNISFTLGKAHEDMRQFELSFKNYGTANSIRHKSGKFNVARLDSYVSSAKEVFTKELFETRKGQGASDIDPIFIVGLHRAGSTLTEQILSSHSLIEGTRELSDMLEIGRHFGSAGRDGTQNMQRLLADISADELAALGATYMEAVRSERKTDRPFFIDKMPGNWMYAGLIPLILPKAKIIDIRRKPMAAGFALFKMNFGGGVDHSYDQKAIAGYYNAYAGFMDHLDDVLPGRIHHIQYERLVSDTEAEIRRLIDYCDVPFEAECLRYWETDRAVQTPSSEQVRQPIFESAVSQWENYAQWLEPMRAEFTRFGLA